MSDPTDVIQEFLTSVTAGDLPHARAVWVEGKPAEQFVQTHRRSIEKRCLRLVELQMTVAALSENSAIVDTTETFENHSTISPAMRPETSHSRFTLRRDGETWRIASWDSHEGALIERLIAAPPADRARLLAEAEELQTEAFVRRLARRTVDLVNQAKIDDAAQLLALASPIADRLGDGALQAGILSSRSVVARHRFDYELAVELGEQAIALAEDAGDPDMMAAALLRTMRAKEEVTGSIDEKSLQRIIAIADHLDNIALASHAATHIGRFYEGRSERRRGFQYAELAWRYAEESGDPAARISASILLGGGFFHMNHHRLALKHFREAAELSFQVGHQKAAALATASLAHAYGGLGHDEDVERVLQDGLHRLRDPQSVAEIMTTLAQFRVGQGKPKEAEELLECVQTLVPSDVTGAPRIALLYASIRFRQGQYEEAFRYAESARGHRTKHSRSARELMAMALRGLGRTDEAVHLLESVAAERELDIDPIADPQMVVFGSTSSMHERWLDALVALGRNDEALRVSERLKATELRQALSDGDMHRVTLPASDAKRERAIVDRIAELNRKLVAAPHDDVLREELADAHNTLLDFRQRTYSLAAPEARVQHPAPFRIETLSPSLDEVAILSYVVVDDKILILLLEPKRNGARKLTVRTSAVNRSALRRTIDRYATGLDSRDLHAPAVGVELYKLLIGPIEKELRPVKQLCIIPADHLWRVPFHALGPSGKAMLVDRLAVFYAPSIAVLEATATKREQHRVKNQQPTLLAFANPVVSDEVASLYRSLDRTSALGALPEAETEVRNIAKIYGTEHSRVRTGSAAREAALKSEASRYDVLHIATHGLIYDQMPMFSSLLLSAEPQDRADDGLLEAREIVGLQLNADLAVLSACETGKANGGGVIGLSWALLAAGCPTTVVSQWRAQSQATAKLMVEFHRQLVAGASKPEALRRAQLKLRSDARYRHPFYWAPFVVVGAP